MRWAWLCFFFIANASWAASIEESIKTVKSVSKEGKGNTEAATAIKSLVAAGSEALIPSLAGMDGADSLTTNWLRGAVDGIVEKMNLAGKKLPADQLETFVLDSKHSPSPRRLAYELLLEIDPKVKERILPKMLDDRSGEMRYDAIDEAMKKVPQDDQKKAIEAYQEIFKKTRNLDQATKIAKALEKLEQKTDLTSHFGVIKQWNLIGPFDSPRGTGYDKAAEPEKKIDLKAEYVGKKDEKLTWKPVTAEKPLGEIDLNKSIAKHKDAFAYAHTTINYDGKEELAMQIRVGTINAVRVFLNGKELFAREEYHHGMRFDQFIIAGKLKPGKNDLLLKICQNDQTEPYAQNWTFQARLSDETGGRLDKVSIEGQK